LGSQGKRDGGSVVHEIVALNSMARRIIDVLVALAALLVLAPVLLAIALAVVLDSRGSPLFLAPRVGLGGRCFWMLKFRTMFPGAECGSAITSRADARITRLGAVLRRTKLDELPQFVNLLLGDLTLVGPRPETPAIVSRYSAGQRTVLVVKPGITGCVQLESGEEAESIPPDCDAEQYYVQHLVDKKLDRDLQYVRSRTAWTDARIVLETAALVIRSIVRPFRNPSEA
jgi:lipopolysaccharide/colanic/teichoic acid biosynthesis glycosyltransferase